ncbi:MAG: hypothetical protein WCF65_08400 [Parachlamydiaceae bacterium]
MHKIFTTLSIVLCTGILSLVGKEGVPILLSTNIPVSDSGDVIDPYMIRYGEEAPGLVAIGLLGAWNSPVEITGTVTSSDVWASGIGHDFIAVWVDGSGNAQSSFSSSSGRSWTMPVQIATEIQSGTDVSISACEVGFIAAWIGSDHNAYASLSTDNGKTWSTPPTQITDDESVSIASDESKFCFVSMTAASDTCIFTWVDSNTGCAMSNSAKLEVLQPAHRHASGGRRFLNGRFNGRKKTTERASGSRK